jgi:hypothetical protein
MEWPQISAMEHLTQPTEIVIAMKQCFRSVLTLITFMRLSRATRSQRRVHMCLVDLGDATVETKQLAPGTKPDSVYVWGIRQGLPEEDIDIARMMLAREAAPE